MKVNFPFNGIKAKRFKYYEKHKKKVKQNELSPIFISLAFLHFAFYNTPANVVSFISRQHVTNIVRLTSSKLS